MAQLDLMSPFLPSHLGPPGLAESQEVSLELIDIVVTYKTQGVLHVKYVFLAKWITEIHSTVAFFLPWV